LRETDLARRIDDGEIRNEASFVMCREARGRRTFGLRELPEAYS
jgi:hypothetical protein